MLQQLALLALSLSLCQGDIIHLRLQEPEELPGFGQRVVFASDGQTSMPRMQSVTDELPAMGLPLFGMSRTANGDWDSWMDSQFNAINAMNQAVLGRRGGCGGHMRQQESFGPILLRGVPTMTTPSAVMQRLASARFGNDILRALIENQMEMDRQWSSNEAPEVDMLGDMLAADATIPQMPLSQAEDGEAANLDITMLSSPLSALDAEVAAEDELSWEQNERLLNQADEDEEADAEADMTEADPAVWTSFMPTWISSPDDLETSDDAAPASSINWSFQNDDGSLNWGLIVFIVQATACVSVWAGLMVTLGYYRLRRSSSNMHGRSQFATSADSHLITPLMYESAAKGDHSSQLYEDLYQVEDAKLHADDREYVAIQYVPLKSDS